MLLADLIPSEDAYVDEALDGDMQGAALRMARIYFDRYPYIIDWSNSEGKTCLHIGSLKGNEELVRVCRDVCLCLLHTCIDHNNRCYATLARTSICQTTKAIHHYIS